MIRMAEPTPEREPASNTPSPGTPGTGTPETGTPGAPGTPDAGGDRRCPICAGPAPLDADFAPFCSDRCKLADLGNWFSGRYVISREASIDDFDDPDTTVVRGEPGGS